MRASAIVDIIKIRLFREEDVRSFLITLSFFFCSLIAVIIDFSKFISLSGIILAIEASFTVASCFRLSIRGRVLTSLLPINPLAPVTKIVILGFSVSELILLYGDLFCPFSTDLFRSALFNKSFDVSKALVLPNFFIYWLLDLRPCSFN